MAAESPAVGTSPLVTAVLALARSLDATLSATNTTADNKTTHATLTEFWEGQADGLDTWYARGDTYWSREDVPPTVNGMLGGLEAVAPGDAAASNALLKELAASRPQMAWGAVVDLGGGIGRVSKAVLAQHFARVDLVEQNAALAKVAEEEYLVGLPQLGGVETAGLQDWAPADGSYDCVWLQWVAGYILDPHFVSLLRRAGRALRPGGVVVVKENVTFPATAALWMDHEDASTIRSQAYFAALFRAAGLQVLQDGPAADWPADLFPIHVWVLQCPSADTDSTAASPAE